MDDSEKYRIIPFGELQVGDSIPGLNGNVVVTKTYDTHIPETMFELTFDNSESIQASGNHLWYIETKLDRDLHKRRVKDGRKIFKNVPKHIVDEMKKVLLIQDRTEIGLSDVVNLLEANDNLEMMRALIRIAESIGPVAEENKNIEDLETQNIIQNKTIYLYDGHQFMQQILAFCDKVFEKQYPIIVGRVVSTEEIFRLSETTEIHIPEIEKN